MKFKKFRPILALFTFCVLAVVAICFYSFLISKENEFDSGKWKEGDAQIRSGMLNNLKRTVLHTKLSEEMVFNLLGPPDRKLHHHEVASPERGDYLFYYYNIELSDTSYDTRCFLHTQLHF